ncbi:hypothetical protein BC828DRAFT_382474 [Blastocladiella britannica]|nr:hypothetical protein BC828DRAFT_382474 [Blastocladiella britannica]
MRLIPAGDQCPSCSSSPAVRVARGERRLAPSSPQAAAQVSSLHSRVFPGESEPIRVFQLSKKLTDKKRLSIGPGAQIWVLGYTHLVRECTQQVGVTHGHCPAPRDRPESELDRTRGAHLQVPIWVVRHEPAGATAARQFRHAAGRRSCAGV